MSTNEFILLPLFCLDYLRRLRGLLCLNRSSELAHTGTILLGSLAHLLSWFQFRCKWEFRTVEAGLQHPYEPSWLDSGCDAWWSPESYGLRPWRRSLCSKIVVGVFFLLHMSCIDYSNLILLIWRFWFSSAYFNSSCFHIWCSQGPALGLPSW